MAARRRKNIHPASPRSLRAAAARLRRGELVAFPTETVYGLGANALDEKAVANIFGAKGRPAGNPVIVHVSDRKMLRRVIRRLPPLAVRLAARFWPGPLTLILSKKSSLPSSVTAGLDTVAVRMPAGPCARARPPRGRADRRSKREPLRPAEPDDGAARRRGLSGRLRSRRRTHEARSRVDRRHARAFPGDPETGCAE